jgi:hypothetical protein
MEDLIYETQTHNIDDIRRFEKWLDAEIGTEYERNDDGEGSYYLLVFELTPREVDKIGKWEKSHA